MAMTSEKEIATRYQMMSKVLDERQLRVWAGAEAIAAGRGGRELVARATPLSRTTVLWGIRDARLEAPPEDLVKTRRKGAGRKRIQESQPGILAALESLVDPLTRGDPESPLRWTCKSTRTLAEELQSKGFSISQHKVGELLHELGYSLQATKKMLEGESHPDRDEQFRYINAQVEDFQARGQPVISVDTKKKELVGEFQNKGHEWQPKGAPLYTNTHDFPQAALGKAIPYGVYDVGANLGWVTVGLDHDTPAFAVNTVRTWWKRMGTPLYPAATELLITADAGGSNGYRSRAWKAELQRLATETGMKITVAHFPPGTSKWNKIEHRLFLNISMNWRGRPLEDYETVVQLIGSTKTRTGLKVKSKLDRRSYRLGQTVTNSEMKALSISAAEFHGEWNYVVSPQQIA